MLIGLFHAPGEKDVSQSAYVVGRGRREVTSGGKKYRAHRNKAPILDRPKKPVDAIPVSISGSATSQHNEAESETVW